MQCTSCQVEILNNNLCPDCAEGYANNEQIALQKEVDAQFKYYANDGVFAWILGLPDKESL